MAKNQISCLTEFLHQSGAKYRIFDMGRRVVKLSADDFVSFENASKPYPYPFKQAALFGLVFWHAKRQDQRYVWFLNFPLDEQGLLVQAARDEFLVMLLDRVGECMLAADKGELIEGALKDSPYSFKPREDKMAAFNAKVTHSLALKPSQYYAAAQTYFSGQSAQADWQSLGMQGIADLACRLDDDQHTLALIKTLPLMPVQPFTLLCSFLENAQPTAALVDVFSQKITMQLQKKQPDIGQICACLRAISNSPAQGLVDATVKQVLHHPLSVNIEILVTISARMWRVLQQDQICQLFVEQLAINNVGQDAFSQVLADIMYMPAMRSHIMQALRSTNRSPALSRAVGKMFS